MSAIKEGLRTVAMRFLQTVVVVDDHAYKPVVEAAVEPATLGENGDPSLDVLPTPLGDEATSGAESGAADVGLEPDAEALDTEVIVETFADLGMACAVLAPRPDSQDDDTRRLTRLAHRADILILDWIIRPSAAVENVHSGPAKGRTSLELLRAVLRADAEEGARLRLVCIYTGSRELAWILNQIADEFSEEFPGAKKQLDRNFIDLGNARIVLLAKVGVQEVSGLPTVPARELPDRVVGEFADFVTGGILPQLALSSLSALRDQAHRLLRRFNANLDPALISHRSITSPVETEQFILSLVGDELASLVASANVTDALADDEVLAAVNSRFVSRDHAYAWNAFNAGAAEKRFVKDDAIKALTLGVEGEKIRQGSGAKIAKNASRTPLLLDGLPDHVRKRARKIDLEFSALSSLSRDRAFDGEKLPPPELQLGSLILQSPRHAGEQGPEGRIWLCLQPLCDSARLTKPTRFPFLPVIECDEKSVGFDLVAFSGEHRALKLDGLKFNRIEFFSFAPDLERSAVVASWRNDGWHFRDESAVDFAWLGNVRLDKSHKLINAVVGDAGRIGINEYEYLRRLSGR